MTPELPRSDLAARLRAIAHAARQQHGAFTRSDALRAGFSARAIDKRVAKGAWVAVDHGVYRAAESPGSWEQRLHAACLASCPTVASHRSAAALWGLPDFERTTLEVTSVRHRRRKAEGIVWHETVRLDDRHVTTIENIPATSMIRTLLDLGSVVDERRLLIALDDAVRRHLTTVETVSRELERFGDRRRGSGVVRRTVARRLDRRPTPGSPLESLFDILVHDHGLSVPARQWPVRNADGHVIARVDFAYPAARLAIEIDGAAFHGGAEASQRDDRRTNRIVLLGWRVLRFTARDLADRPADVAREIQEALSFGPASLSVE